MSIFARLRRYWITWNRPFYGQVRHDLEYPVARESQIHSGLGTAERPRGIDELLSQRLGRVAVQSSRPMRDSRTRVS